MIRRSEWGHHRSIRRLVWIDAETRQDEAFSTGWTDAMIRGSAGLSDGYEDTYSKGLAKRSSAPDEPTHRRCIASEQLCQQSCNGWVTWRAPDEPTPWKSIASVHSTLPFLAAFSQQLVWCIGLFIPPPLTHLRWLDCVEVQRSSRHLEDNIQSIQVLNCSSLDLHILSVCA
jgi:hypothetical protein